CAFSVVEPAADRSPANAAMRRSRHRDRDAPAASAPVAPATRVLPLWSSPPPKPSQKYPFLPPGVQVEGLWNSNPVRGLLHCTIKSRFEIWRQRCRLSGSGHHVTAGEPPKMSL